MRDDPLDWTTDIKHVLEDVSLTNGLDLLDCVTLPLDRSDNPFVFPAPVPGNPAFLRRFDTIIEWREFILSHNLNPLIPEIIAAKFQRAQKLYFLAWIDYDVIKAGELMALAALEHALKSRYGNMMLGSLLKHMVESDGLTNEKIPMFQKYGFPIVENLYEPKPARKTQKTDRVVPSMTLSGIRNSLAHGDPFDSMPWSGLLELVRDLVEYAYRDRIARRAL